MFKTPSPSSHNAPESHYKEWQEKSTLPHAQAPKIWIQALLHQYLLPLLSILLHHLSPPTDQQSNSLSKNIYNHLSFLLILILQSFISKLSFSIFLLSVFLLFLLCVRSVLHFSLSLLRQVSYMKVNHFTSTHL